MVLCRGVRMSDRAPLPPIRFQALAQALLARIHTLVPRWVPGGVIKNGEYLALSPFRTEKNASFSVRMDGENAGRWADFGGDLKGGDLLSLYAELHALSMAKAAVQVAHDEGLQDVAGVVSSPDGQAPPVRPAPPPAAAAPARPVVEEGWQTVRPVPGNVPTPTFWHPHRQPQDIEHKAEYRHGADLMGYVVRFRTSDGGKDTLPHTWCLSGRTGTLKWHWRQFDEPRPLYLPSHELPGERTVVLVEGEKKGDALQALLDAGAPGVYCVASWPGGCKAWKKADWAPLAGRTVILWPDCDSKREPLTRAEKEAHPDHAAQLVLAQSKPFIAFEKQGGMAAMLGIGAHLRDVHACAVSLLPIPKPGEVVDGWDCGDAINTDGWDFDRVLAFFGQAQSLLASTPASTPAAPSAAGEAADGSSAGEPPGGEKIDPLADAGHSGDAFQDHLDFMCSQQDVEVWELGVNRKLIIAALRKAPRLQGRLGFDELTGVPSTTAPWPWRDEAGPLADSDDLRLGDWLCSEYKLKAASRAALAEAIDTVADGHHFHPIRDWLQGLRWDGKPRLERWLIHALSIDIEVLKNPGPDSGIPRTRLRFLQLMGKYFLMGLVARVMQPGCKFDYSPVFEGRTGMGKSTLVEVLVGKDHFSDTHFDIGNGKDGLEQLQGLWAYELSEMTAFKRADSEQIKQFFSSTVDRYRGAYGRFVQKHPRQCVIFCTTNKRQYLYDLTGNRRFWPVWVEQPVKIEWLRKWRDQLFAEAFAAFTAGERFYPEPDEEKTYFYPEQELRLVETTVQAKLYELLTREGSFNSEGRATEGISQMTRFVTLPMLVTALGADAAKSTSLLESQIRGWLEAMGWTLGRESVGQRRRGYKQPEQWPPKDAELQADPAPDEAPADQPQPVVMSPAQAFLADGLDDDEPF